MFGPADMDDEEIDQLTEDQVTATQCEIFGHTDWVPEEDPMTHLHYLVCGLCGYSSPDPDWKAS